MFLVLFPVWVCTSTHSATIVVFDLEHIGRFLFWFLLVVDLCGVTQDDCSSCSISRILSVIAFFCFLCSVVLFDGTRYVRSSCLILYNLDFCFLLVVCCGLHVVSHRMTTWVICGFVSALFLSLGFLLLVAVSQKGALAGVLIALVNAVLPLVIRVLTLGIGECNSDAPCLLVGSFE